MGEAEAGKRTKQVTVRTLLKRKEEKQPIAGVSVYDATFARLFDEAGIDFMLVGDSLGMVFQGKSTTLSVTLDHMVYHCNAVCRVTRYALVAADMPFMSYQVNADDALRSAGRLLKETGVQAVKLEGGAHLAPTVARLCESGIPVVGHVGLQPQAVHALGGYRVQGREQEAADALINDALSLQQAGAFALVLEAIPRTLAKAVTESLNIPTIGIGAGSGCDGQVLVGHDLLGFTPGRVPSFVKRYARFYEDGVNAAALYCKEVRARTFPSEAHSFGNSTGE